MRKLRGSLCLVLWLCAASATAQISPTTTTPAETAPPVTAIPRWQVISVDTALGVMIGNATVDWENQAAQVEFGYGGKKYRLDSRTMLPPSDDDPKATLWLMGASPAAAPTARPDASKAQQLTGPGEAKVKVGHEEATYSLDTPESADDRKVRVELAPVGDGVMIGRWDYQADPVTLRDAKGDGRSGQFTMASNGGFIGRASDSELWLPLRPEIEFAAVLDDQIEIPYLTFEDTLSPATLRAKSSNAGEPDKRYLFVVGRNLPIVPVKSDDSIATRNVGKFEPGSLDTDYTYVGQSGDDLPLPDRVRIRSGWFAVTQGIKDRAKRAEILSLESALIKVDITHDYLPGMREFSWGGAKIPWRLLTRDARPTVRFLRPIGDDWEEVPEAYLPESIAVELRLPAPIPFPSFKVAVRPFVVGADGEAHAIGPEQEWVAPKKRTGVYRTELHLLSKQGGGGFEMQPGAILVAHAKPTDGLLSTAATAELSVTSSAGQQADTVEVPDPDHPGVKKKVPVTRTTLIWPEYVLNAAKTQDKETTDPRNLALKKETHLSTWLITILDRVKTDIYYGDHAAMLLLRDTFRRMMKKADAALADAIATNDSALGYARIARTIIRSNPKSALATLGAGSLNGRAMTLADATNPDLVNSGFNGDRQARDDWLSGAVKTAVTEYRGKLQKSLAVAEKIDDGEIEKLLKLTGNAFDSVVDQALPRLMRLDDAAQRWVPDDIARGYVRGVANKFKELRAYQEASSIDNELLIGVAFAVTGVPTAFSHSAFAYTLAAAGEGSLLAATSGAEVYHEFKKKDEVAFAFGASPVLGDARFQEAVLEDPGWTRVLGGIGINVALSGWNVLGNLRKAQAALQIERGARLLEASVQPIYGLARFAENEQRDLLAFLAHAKSLSKQGATLSSTEAAAVQTLERLGDIVAKEPEISAKLVSVAGRLSDAETTIATLVKRSIAAKAAKEVIESQRLRREMFADIWRAAEKDPKVLLKLSDFDFAWMSGAIAKADENRALVLAQTYGLNWHDLKLAFQDGKISAAEMHNFVTHREDLMKKLLDESITEVASAIERETGRKPNLIRKALGSTNLTSDLDFSVFGEGAERVVKGFNDKFRALPQFKGLESGHVFDTNVYTQAVYELFGRKELVGKSLGMANSDLDALRQLMYEQMATRKYIGGAAEWQKHTGALLGAAPDATTKKMLTYAFEEADYAYTSARQTIAKRMGVAGEDALHAAEGSNDLLKATNQEYERLLGDIGQWRTERTRLQQLMTGSAERLPDASAEFLDRYPGWRAGIDELKKLQGAVGKESDFQKLANTWSDRLAYQLRKKQGEALFFASEAYQDEGTILHVVKDLQEAKRGKEITVAKLQGGKASKVLDELDGRGALNSMMENLANLRKELGHADDAARGAAKGGKYFIRVLDAGHEAGIDVVKILGEDLVIQTIGVDASRASIEKVVAFLKDRKTTPDSYVKALEVAHERLGTEMAKHKDITNLAGRVSQLFEDVPGAAAATQKSAAIGEVAH